MLQVTFVKHGCCWGPINGSRCVMYTNYTVQWCMSMYYILWCFPLLPCHNVDAQKLLLLYIVNIFFNYVVVCGLLQIGSTAKLDSYTNSLDEWVRKMHWLSSVTLCDFSFLCVSVCIFAGRYPSALITSAQTQTFCSRELKSRDLKSHLSLLLNACGCVCLNACVRVTGAPTWSGSQFEERVNEGGI